MAKELEKFANNFDGLEAPKALLKLFEFQEEYGFESYSEGFGLMAEKKSALASWSGVKDKNYLNELIPFAQATGGGSFYALWKNGSKDTNQMPVVIFGDEGGTHIVAEHVLQLLELLTFDSEPMVDWDEISYYKDKDFEPTDSADEYQTWLKKNYKISETKNPEKIIKQAQKKYLSAYNDWKSKYLKE